jgi:hypothetical protein
VEAREYILADPEPDPIPRLQAELDAEVGRLCAGDPGKTELDFIYRTRPGPVSRRWAILDLSVKRIGRAMKPYLPGVVELTVVCMPFQVTMELAYAERIDQVRIGPVAQRVILLPIVSTDLYVDHPMVI